MKWYSKIYENQGSLLFAPVPFDWSEQIVVITGGKHNPHPHPPPAHPKVSGSSGIGELLANTLAVKSVNVVVLDVNPIESDNCMSPIHFVCPEADTFQDNISYYKCDVSKWEEVEHVSKKIIEEVCSVLFIPRLRSSLTNFA